MMQNIGTWYTIETITDDIRYAGPDFDQAGAALIALGREEDVEGYAVATVYGLHSPAKSGEVEVAAILADA